MNPCITIDVSKETSHVQGFLDNNVPLSKPRKILHTKEGFSNILTIYNQMIYRTGIKPTVFFEYTGVYHKTLIAYLKANNLSFIPIPPLVAAKVRNSDLRNKKTDARDCKTLSFVYYDNKVKKYYEPTKDEKKLKDLQRYYMITEKQYQEITVHLYEVIDTIYPFYKSIMSEFDCFTSLKFLQKYPHPDYVTSHREKTLIKDFMEITGHGEKYATNVIHKLLNVINDTIPGCNSDDFEVEMLKDYAAQALFYKTRLNKTLEEINRIINQDSSKKSLVENIDSIPGIARNTAARFIAEVSNVDRFKSSKALIAFAGTDPNINQSGIIDGKHLSITKCGSKRLRTILFLMVRSMIRKRIADNPIKDFYKKKTQLGLPPKVVLVACINKLLGIIYQLNKTGEVFVLK
jgi:transposase